MMRTIGAVTLALAVMAVAGFSSEASAGGAPVGQVSNGYYHSCAVSRGGVQCWGYNADGQLGNNKTQDSLYPVYAFGLGGGSGVTAVSAGYAHTCAVVNGGLQCWGANDAGQLGTGNTVPSLVPVAVYPENGGVTAVSAGYAHTCAVVNTQLQCWGENEDGQLGTGDTNPSSNPVTIIPSGATAVVAGAWHTCAIVNGGLQCWGGNYEGELGTGSTDQSLVPVAVPGLDSGVTSIAASPIHTCAVVNFASAYCWGSNDYGQLGNGNQDPAFSPTPVANLSNIGSIIALGAGGDPEFTASHSCAVVVTGAGSNVQCWGFNASGQLGNGTLDDSAIPVVVASLSNIYGVSAGGDTTCAVSGDGNVFCAGSDYNGEVGDGGQPVVVKSPTISPALSGMSNISAGLTHACATLLGDAYCWGFNRNGELGQGTTTDDALPDQVQFAAPGGVDDVAAGNQHSCAILIGSVYCWGLNDHGQLGDGGTMPSGVPVANGVNSAVGMDAGNAHSCAVGSNGNVQCWGAGSSGQLGNNAFVDAYSPVGVMSSAGNIAVPLTGVTSVTAGATHSCAVVAGAARCWGENSNGQLGDGTQTPSSIAVAVNGLTGSVYAIDAGAQHTCALVDDGVRCWGSNATGQLGDGTQTEAHTPVVVDLAEWIPLTGATGIATGSNHSCALVDGGVMCWGSNGYGELGNGTLTASAYAVAALPAGSGVLEISAGDRYTCASSGVLTWCWGNGYNGRLGNGSLGYSVEFVIADSLFRDGFEND